MTSGSFLNALPLCLLLILLPFSNIGAAGYQAELQQPLDGPGEPEGVVFEIAGKQAETLNWALAKAARRSAMLRHRFPALEIAIVTHGREQFALTRQQRAKNAGLNENLQSRVESRIQVHVCGTHAEKRGSESGSSANWWMWLPPDRRGSMTIASSACPDQNRKITSDRLPDHCISVGLPSRLTALRCCQ